MAERSFLVGYKRTDLSTEFNYVRTIDLPKAFKTEYITDLMAYVYKTEFEKLKGTEKFDRITQITDITNYWTPVSKGKLI
jgi:hypothetical protein